jgi:iron complex outermembrane receptor protein
MAGVAIAQDESAAQEPEQPAAAVTDVLVVTASRTEQRLQEVPASMTVISAEEIATMPADDFGDILRTVPGLNVSQLSARDIQVSGRTATNSLANNELVLLDGRTLYIDFFGFVMWDFMPMNPREIKQIEVVRGPGSAVWGANAMSGVINLITKSPREMAGTSLILGAGELNTSYGYLTHAGANDRLGYKVSGSYYKQDPFERPTGIIPGTSTPYPSFQNQGTEQPKLDLRLDYDQSLDTTLRFSGGYAGTDGIMHSGIGPFAIDSGTKLSYFKTDWSKRAMRATFFTNILDGNAQNLLTVGPDGRPIQLGFDTKTYNLDFSNTSILGENNIITYGATARHNDFALTIAPRGDSRDEYGAFLQDEILLGDKVRWLVGGRFDNIDPIGSVFSPRTALMLSPTPNHTFRLSYNRAFRAPSVINNFLDIAIVNRVVLPLPTGPLPFIFGSLAIGNEDLKEERLDAYEIGYVGTFKGTNTFSLSVYQNKTKDSIDFYSATFYNAANPPAGWPLPPIFLNFPPLAGALPSSFSYRNIGSSEDQGLEASLTMRPSAAWSWFVNYSYQDEPKVTGIDPSEVNKPPKHRYNFGGAYNGPTLFTNFNVNYVDSAFWTDVLDSRFHGPTEDFTQINMTVGVRLFDDKIALSLIGTNLLDTYVQQHIFGDIISRKFTAQVAFNF